ncbi:SWIB/MDM2 domain-containing protein, putative [Plasmodium yoelii]|uniref:SWIB/MDM2 domain-containing protein n=2 Tax=Plasmodium yoelii TaxID=5861 RepID=A0AAE9WSW0_PLAYO|nr:SWIB/MDM2 domain-containing protein, putative [Plasmodium yoelii]WBY59395.1 SWIB/MDM2 domain-containing protein [Plasmodium yoelii yoelii]CDU19526.1 SWIB/MDM2 domain-containing protein, putative [Plasmodium yoelii]VTZ80162.1 SWIB/MDM2 domain-containing protein, putative [Plasmodium yoelii]|eukprot:XP_730600.2 SWIB/MDM2 domain-containing protein, putative [Plasmodium yoelii]
MNTVRAKFFIPKNKIIGHGSFSPLNKFMTKYNYSTSDKNNENIKEKKPNGLQIDCEIKSPLKEFLNTDTASRVFVLKYAWKYIKDNNLQDPDMKRKIIPDQKLKQVLEKDEVDMLEIPKLLFKHVTSYRKE